MANSSATARASASRSPMGKPRSRAIWVRVSSAAVVTLGADSASAGSAVETHQEFRVGLGLLQAADEHVHRIGGGHALHGAAQRVDAQQLLRRVDELLLPGAALVDVDRGKMRLLTRSRS